MDSSYNIITFSMFLFLFRTVIFYINCIITDQVMLLYESLCNILMNWLYSVLLLDGFILLHGQYHSILRCMKTGNVKGNSY